MYVMYDLLIQSCEKAYEMFSDTHMHTCFKYKEIKSLGRVKKEIKTLSMLIKSKILTQ